MDVAVVSLRCLSLSLSPLPITAGELNMVELAKEAMNG
jgi:hypothetical protein